MQTKLRSRGNRVELEPEWLDLLSYQWDQVRRGRHHSVDKMTQAEFGAALAKEVGRNDPFSDASVSRFLSGKQVTDEMTLAFSRLFSLPYPLLCITQPEEAVLFENMRAIRKSPRTKEIFDKLLSYTKQLAQTIKDEKAAEIELAAILKDV